MPMHEPECTHIYQYNLITYTVSCAYIYKKHETNTIRHNQQRHAIMVDRYDLTLVAILNLC